MSRSQPSNLRGRRSTPAPLVIFGRLLLPILGDLRFRCRPFPALLYFVASSGVLTKKNKTRSLALLSTAFNRGGGESCVKELWRAVHREV